MKKSILRPF